MRYCPNCGDPLLDAQTICLRCTHEYDYAVKSQAQSAINPFKAAIPIPADPGLAKFILETHTFDGGSVTVFARGDNEMIVGKVTTSKDSAAQGMFGEIPGQDQITRAFLTEQAAIAWVKEQCMAYGSRRDVDWIVRKVDHGEQDLIVPAKGPMMPPRRM